MSVPRRFSKQAAKQVAKMAAKQTTMQAAIPFAAMLALGATPAMADLRPAPDWAHRPYLQALQAAGHPCARITSRVYEPNAELAERKLARIHVACANGPRYAMVVRMHPRQSRPRESRNIDSFDVVSITPER